LASIRIRFRTVEDVTSVWDYSYLKGVVEFFCESLVFGFEPYCLAFVERCGILILSVGGILGNVIPYYLSNDVARRHTAQRKANMVLLVHIISGIGTVLVGGVIGLMGGYPGRISFYCHAVIDIAHILSIFPLCRNHDGVYSLRAGNLYGAVVKIKALMNFDESNGLLTADVIFLASSAFIGTRIATATPKVILYLTGHRRVMKFDHWYSLGLSFIQSYIPYRIGNEEIWLWCNILSAVWFYHELWDKKYQSAFVAFHCVFTALCLALLKQQVLYFYIAKVLYYAVMFKFRYFKRHPIKMAILEKSNADRKKLADATEGKEAKQVQDHMVVERCDVMFD